MLKKFALATIAMSTAITMPAAVMPVTVMAETKNYFDFDFEDTLEQSAAEYESQRETEMPDMSDIEVRDDALANGIEVGGENTNHTADTFDVAADALTQDTSVKMTMNAVGSMTMPADVDEDEEPNAAPITQDINMQVSADIKADTDTKNISVDMTVGMDGDEQFMQTYVNLDGSQVTTYASDDGESWTKETADVSDIMSSANSAQQKIDTEVKNMLGDPVQEDLNGVVCNHFSGVIAVDNILDQLTEEIIQAEIFALENGTPIFDSEVQNTLSAFDGVEIPIEYYEDAADAKPVKLDIDMSGIEFNTLISSILGEGYSFECSELSIEFDFSYDAVDVQIPDTVLTSEEEVDTASDDADAEFEYGPEGSIENEETEEE